MAVSPATSFAFVALILVSLAFIIVTIYVVIQNRKRQQLLEQCEREEDEVEESAEQMSVESPTVTTTPKSKHAEQIVNAANDLKPSLADDEEVTAAIQHRALHL